MNAEPVKYLFRAKTKESDAFVIKILGELLSNVVTWSPFTVTEKGISLNQRDDSNQQWIEILLNKSDFHVFKCEKPINFLVHSNTFYKMLKTIKKKDTITLFITEADPLRLGITVEQQTEKNKVTTYIKISYHQPEDIHLGADNTTEYGSPLIISSKEFQKLKILQPISETIKIKSNEGKLTFSCDAGELVERELVINTEDEEESEMLPNNYEQTYTTETITQLTKCAGQSGNTVHIFIQRDLPLKIKMRAGNLGELIIYIKSKEMIEMEEDEANNVEENQTNDSN
jgi:proliferating cell nuclear antigen PCNA